MWENVKNLPNHVVGRRFLHETKRRGERNLAHFWHFHTWIESFSQSNGLYQGLETGLSWKETQFIGENVKNLSNLVVGRGFAQRNKTLENIPLWNEDKSFFSHRNNFDTEPTFCTKISMKFLIFQDRRSNFLTIRDKNSCLDLFTFCLLSDSVSELLGQTQSKKANYV